MLVVFIAIVGASILFLYVPSPVVSISYPTAGIVQQNVIVYGTASNVPLGAVLVACGLRPQYRLYYPQNPAVIIQPSGKWSGQMYLGSANDASKQFTISAVLAVNGTFASYARNAETTGNWPGITPENYANSVNTCDQITVTRA